MADHEGNNTAMQNACVKAVLTVLKPAVDLLREMRSWEIVDEIAPENHIRCKIYLGVASHLVYSGLRSNFAYLVQHRMVDAIVTGPGIEADVFMSLFHLYVVDHLPKVMPEDLKTFRAWAIPVFRQLVVEQETMDVKWTFTSIATRLGKELENVPGGRNSILYWAYKNEIPIYCTKMFNGEFGNGVWPSVHGLRVHDDAESALLADIRSTKFLQKTGVIMLGEADGKEALMRAYKASGRLADFALFVKSDLDAQSSAAGGGLETPFPVYDEKNYVQVAADATIVFPILVGEAFVV